MEGWLTWWYDWGVIVGVLIVAAAATYIFVDSQQTVKHGVALRSRPISLIGLLLMLPSLYYRLTKTESAEVLSDGNLAIPDNNFSIFFFMALVGLALAMIGLIYYFLRERGEAYRPAPIPTYAPSPPPPQRPLSPTMPLSQEPPPQAWLALRAGPRVGTMFGLGMSRPNVIGRDPYKADIILDEDSVSREHADIHYENGQFVIYDKASTGGTYINGIRVASHVLQSNDRINLGQNIELVFMKVDEQPFFEGKQTLVANTPEERLKSLRMDVALPEQVVVREWFTMAIALRQMSSPRLAEVDLINIPPGKVQIILRSRQVSTTMEARVIAPDCYIHGPANQIFQFIVESDSPVLFFTLAPKKEGKITITAAIYQLELAREKTVGSARVSVGAIMRERYSGSVTTTLSTQMIHAADKISASVRETILGSFIEKHFSLDELRNLCFELGIDFDNLDGSTKTAKSRELVLYCKRHSMLERLNARVVYLRPNWYDLQVDISSD